MNWWWNWRESKFVEKMKQGIVFYTKPNKNIHLKEIKKQDVSRRLETKRVRTHGRK